MPDTIFCNDENKYTSDYLKGIKVVHRGLYVSVEKHTILLNRDRGNRVALMTGCGCGHEPFPAGLIGENFLTGCVLGPVFNTMSVPQILNAMFNLIKWNRGGIMIVSMNYCCLVLNLRTAARRAIEAGINVKMVIMTDDCALERNHMKFVYENMHIKRSLGGMVLCCKILGGMSGAGYSLEQIYHHGTMLKLRTASISATYSSCEMPKALRKTFEISRYEIVIGTGGIGEEGLKRVPMAPLKHIVKMMLDHVFELFMISPGDKVLLLLTNSGVCTDSEMFILAKEVENQLAPTVLVMKTLVGKFFTTFDAKGFQITMVNISCNESWLRYIDLDTDAFAWPSMKLANMEMKRVEREPLNTSVYRFNKTDGWKLNYGQAHIFGDCIQSTCSAIKKHELALNAMDAVYRTGDIGTKLKVFADRVLKDIKGASLLMDMSKTFSMLAQIAEDEIDTILGSVLAVLFTGASQASYNWESVWKQALDTLSMYTTARVGHRTLLDALVPAYRAFRNVMFDSGPRFWVKALKSAAEAAKEQCELTKDMIPKTWVEKHGEPKMEPSNIQPDPGAFLVTLWLDVIILETMKKRRFCVSLKKNLVISRKNK